MVIEGIARNGLEAQKLLSADRTHLVFIDIQMPFFTGLELMEAYGHHKYIVVSAFSLFSYAHSALQLGAYDYILKPIDRDAFIASVERAIGFQFHKHPVINEVMSYLKFNYFEPCSLSSLSGIVGMDPSYLSRLFKKETGKTIMSTLHEIRMQQADALLKTKDLDVLEISYKVGYENINTFYRHFNRYFGVTPAERRNTY